MSKTLLFVYGLLQPGFHPPKVVHRQWPDQMKGRLFDLGEHPGAIEIGHGSSTFEGWVLEIEESELAALDEFEDVRGDSHFRRLKAITLGGTEVWIYEYFGPVPDAAPIPHWPSSPELLTGD